MREVAAISTVILLLWIGLLCAQTTGGPQQASVPPGAPPASDGLRDLDAMTFSCARAALNAAAREAAQAPAQGTYQFVYFRMLTGSHHARYEIHFKSNYEGEPDLKYCVMLYCQQGWDPASTQPSVTAITAKSQSHFAAPHLESCAETASAGAKRPKRPSN